MPEDTSVVEISECRTQGSGLYTIDDIEAREVGFVLEDAELATEATS